MGIAYAVRQDLIDRFGQREVTELESNIVHGVVANTPEQLQELEKMRLDATNQSLIDASDLANGYIYAKLQYPNPLPNVPESLKHHVCNIARYLLTKDKAKDEIKERYKEALSWLKDVGKGVFILPFNIEQAQEVVAPMSSFRLVRN